MPLSQLSDAPTVEYRLPLPVPSVFTVSCSTLQGATLANVREFISLRTVFRSFGRDSSGEKDTVLHVWGPLCARSSATVCRRGKRKRERERERDEEKGRMNEG
jgi:hypothetical protein